MKGIMKMNYGLQQELAKDFYNVRAKLILDLCYIRRDLRKRIKDLEVKILDFDFFGKDYDSLKQLRKLKFELLSFETAYIKNPPSLNRHLAPYMEMANRRIKESEGGFSKTKEL